MSYLQISTILLIILLSALLVDAQNCYYSGYNYNSQYNYYCSTSSSVGAGASVGIFILTCIVYYSPCIIIGIVVACCAFIPGCVLANQRQSRSNVVVNTATAHYNVPCKPPTIVKAYPTEGDAYQDNPAPPPYSQVNSNQYPPYQQQQPTYPQQQPTYPQQPQQYPYPPTTGFDSTPYPPTTGFDSTPYPPVEPQQQFGYPQSQVQPPPPPPVQY